ncbi:MAG: hypothetical protein ACM359_18345 [Bacillota bacterium]
MIDLSSEYILSPRQATREPAFRNTEGRPGHISKVYRAFRPGVHGVRLEFVKTPGGIRTSREAIARFVNALTYGPGASVTTTTTQRRAEAAIDRELDAEGIC